MKKTLIILTSAFAAIPAFASFLVEFDSGANYRTNFVKTDNTTGSYTHNAEAGVAGIAGYLNIGTDGEFNVLSNGLTKTAGTIYESSYMIKIGTPASDINDYRAGFSRSTGSNFIGGGDSAYAYLRSDPGVSTYTIELFRSTNSTGFETGQFSLAADTWYQFTVQMTLVSDTSIDLFAALYDVGADGTSSPSLVSGSDISTAFSLSLTNGGFNGEDVFAGFTTRNNTGSVGQGMDNFSFAVVPAGGESIWDAYEVSPEGNVDTGPWLGWVNITNDPWIWSYSLEKYIYLSGDSGWVYIPN